MENIRNFGIIAHIDAGKTTTTERILYITGSNHKIGEVNDGTTTTDWMEEERERGITITAAAVSCKWNNQDLHIIDTPGHVDFTAEVERSLRVLDGAVVIFCGVGGVQPQSETVWKQADKFNIPRISFINKLDRSGANFYNVLNEISIKLKNTPLPITIPYYEKDIFVGVIDILKMKKILFTEDGFIKSEEQIPDSYIEISNKYKENLINILTQFDDELLELELSGKVTIDDIKKSIRKFTLKNKIVPAFAGASFKNIGVPQLLDGITDYLPNPLDIGYCKGFYIKKNSYDKILFSEESNPVLYLFKVHYNKEKGVISFVRVYSGKIKNGDILFNPRTKKRERILDIQKIYADKFERIESAKSGDIVAIIGFKESVTGDTLCNESNQVVLESLHFPEPVIFVRVEPKNAIDLEKFNIAKNYLLLEDPTIKINEDKDTGQILVSGMGELHIEIFLERLKREYKVELKSGNPQVSYRETPLNKATYKYEFDKKIGGNTQHTIIQLSIEPLSRGSGIIIESKLNKNDNMLYFEYIKKGIESALQAGPEAAYPVIDAKIIVDSIEYDQSKVSPLSFEASANICLSYLLRESKTILLQPIMKVEIEVPEIFTGSVIGEFQSRGGIVTNIEKKNNFDIIHAKAPLIKMFGYTTSLRSLTQGKGSFNMEFLEFDNI